MRRINDAQLAIDLREDHVEVNRGPLGGQHDDDDIGHAAMLERQLAQQIERRGARTLAEAKHQQIGADGMDVSAFERVVQPLLIGAVVQNPRVRERRVVAEQRLDEQLLGPAHAVAHRADDRVLADHDADVAREKQVGERRQRVRHFVQGAGDRPPLLHRPLHHQRDEVCG